jgi:adenylate cyclase
MLPQCAMSAISPPAAAASILVVDDVADIRELLGRGLLQQGHEVTFAESGREALALLHDRPIDVVLLDIMMPEMDGYEVLARIQANPALRHIPVIIVSAMGEVESVVRCIGLGADDYLFKPFNPVLLKARVGASLEKKRLRDREHEHLAMIEAEQERSRQLLLGIFPQSVAQRLMDGEKSVIAESFAEATVLFANLTGFSPISATHSATKFVEILDRFYCTFDALAERHGVQKIKTMSDTYILAGGVPARREDHAEAVADTALAMQKAMSRLGAATERLNLKIGIHSGPLVAGVIGSRKIAYDLWGETVHIASQLEAFGVDDSIQVSEATYRRLHGRYFFEPRGPFYVTGTGEVQTYLLRGKREGRSQ